MGVLTTSWQGPTTALYVTIMIVLYPPHRRFRMSTGHSHVGNRQSASALVAVAGFERRREIGARHDGAIRRASAPACLFAAFAGPRGAVPRHMEAGGRQMRQAITQLRCIATCRRPRSLRWGCGLSTRIEMKIQPWRRLANNRDTAANMCLSGRQDETTKTEHRQRRPK